MHRRRVSFGLVALVLSLPGTGLTRAVAQTAAPSSYRAAGDWLFDLYASQSVRMSIANALRQRPPGTDTVLGPTVPVMIKALDRHRDAFVAAMASPLQTHFDAAAISALLTAAGVTPPTLDEVQRRKLFEVDAEFRREQQSVIRAMTADIALMIATTLSEQGQSRQ